MRGTLTPAPAWLSAAHGLRESRGQPLRINEFLLTAPADAATTIPNRNNKANQSTSLSP